MTDDTLRQCPADGCRFMLDENNECWNHGEASVPEYETTNDVPETEATGLGDFL